eukprot:scaffold358_cov256-Pinguiococcus_pyrenoidosus.AAC.27
MSEVRRHVSQSAHGVLRVAHGCVHAESGPGGHRTGQTRSSRASEPIAARNTAAAEVAKKPTNVPETLWHSKRPPGRSFQRFQRAAKSARCARTKAIGGFWSSEARKKPQQEKVPACRRERPLTRSTGLLSENSTCRRWKRIPGQPR